jgi:hypothetical protein
MAISHVDLQSSSAKPYPQPEYGQQDQEQLDHYTVDLFKLRVRTPMHRYHEVYGELNRIGQS